MPTYRSPRTLQPFVIAIVALMATGVAPGQAQISRTRDSAGVRIVELPRREAIPVVFRLADKPQVEVGGLESDPSGEFNHRQGFLRGVRLSNGGLAVIDVSRIHYFDARGNRIRIVGREGSGPEEFRYLTGICRTRGDTLVVYDNSNRRLSVLDQNGRVVRTIAQADHGSARVGSFCFNDGSFALTKSRSGAEVKQGARAVRITRLRLDGTVAGVIGEFGSLPFDMVSQAGVSVVASDTTLFFGDPFAGEIRLYSTTGNLQRILRLTEPRQRITDAEVEAGLARTFPQRAGANSKETIERVKALPRTDTWPAFYSLHVSPEGIIWLHDFHRDYRAATSWTGFDSTGRIVGRLELPTLREGMLTPEVHAFGVDYLMLRRFDADMASYLSTFPISRVRP